MKKNAFLLIAAAILFACSNSETETVVINSEPETPIEQKKEVVKDYDYFMNRISNDEEWMKEIKKQATEQGVSDEEMLIKNAKFMAKQNGFGEKEPIEIDLQIEKIKANPEWLAGVEKQALERGITLDSMLVRSALYTLNQKNNK